MMLEVFKALMIIADFCFAQKNCDECALKKICSKMPCDW